MSANVMLELAPLPKFVNVSGAKLLFTTWPVVVNVTLPESMAVPGVSWTTFAPDGVVIVSVSPPAAAAPSPSIVRASVVVNRTVAEPVRVTLPASGAVGR